MASGADFSDLHWPEPEVEVHDHDGSSFRERLNSALDRLRSPSPLFSDLDQAPPFFNRAEETASTTLPLTRTQLDEESSQGHSWMTAFDLTVHGEERSGSAREGPSTIRSSTQLRHQGTIPSPRPLGLILDRTRHRYRDRNDSLGETHGSNSVSSRPTSTREGDISGRPDSPFIGGWGSHHWDAQESQEDDLYSLIGRIASEHDDLIRTNASPSRPRFTGQGLPEPPSEPLLEDYNFPGTFVFSQTSFNF